MELAKDKYVDRMRKRGVKVQGNITTPLAPGKSWKTCHPDVPVFSEPPQPSAEQQDLPPDKV